MPYTQVSIKVYNLKLYLLGENHDNTHARAIENDFSSILEIHRQLRVDVGLHLSNAPLGILGVADKHSRLEYRVQIFQFRSSSDQEVPMTQGAPDLVALIGSRICHDLISPLGAIGNGVELLSMTEFAPTPEISLIAESVQNANARIRLFRIAFGVAARDARTSADEIWSILDDLGRGGRVTFRFDATVRDLERRHAKILLFLLLCVETAMPYGGQTDIVADTDGWTITARSDRLQVDEDNWNALISNDHAGPVRAGTVQFALVGEAALQAGTRVETVLTDREIRISF